MGGDVDEEEDAYELTEIEEELAAIEVEIANLLTRQSHLIERQKQLKTTLAKKSSISSTTQQLVNHTKTSTFKRSDFPWSASLELAAKTLFGITEFRHQQVKQ